MYCTISALSSHNNTQLNTRCATLPLFLKASRRLATHCPHLLLLGFDSVRSCGFSWGVGEVVYIIYYNIYITKVTNYYCNTSISYLHHKVYLGFRYGWGKQLKDAVKVSLGKNLAALWECDKNNEGHAVRVWQSLLKGPDAVRVSAHNHHAVKVWWFFFIFYVETFVGWLVGCLVGGGICDSLFITLLAWLVGLWPQDPIIFFMTSSPHKFYEPQAQAP